MQHASPEFGSALPLIIMVVMIGMFVVLGALLTVIPFWKICTKAGFPGPLALLMLVPVANIVLPFYIAFADWPALRQTQPYAGPIR
jgi:hypothetical protein